jgi:hypothetical protein
MQTDNHGPCATSLVKCSQLRFKLLQLCDMDKLLLPAAHIHFQQPEREVSDLCTQIDTAV